MKYSIVLTSKYRKERKNMKKRGADLALLDDVINQLAEGKVLPFQYHDHELVGNFRGYRECHIQSDWLLIYRIFDQELILSLERTGTHSELFKK